LPEAIQDLSDKLVEELSKGATGSLKVIPNFFDDENFVTMLFPPQRKDIIEKMHSSMAAHGV